MYPEISRYKKRLDVLFDKSSSFSDDLELQSHWARYLCVIVSGYLEISVKTTLQQYSLSRSHDNVANYVSGKLDRFRSPKMKNIISLVGQFNSDWAKTIADETEGELKASVDSIVNNRHQIAHGKDVGLSLVQINKFYKNAITVVELIIANCS